MSYFAMNTSSFPAEINVVVPNVAVPLKYPVTTVLPAASDLIERPRSGPAPPSPIAQIIFPRGPVLVMKISETPALGIVVLSPNVTEEE